MQGFEDKTHPLDAVKSPKWSGIIGLMEQFDNTES